jgi:hypothetical protein
MSQFPEGGDWFGKVDYESASGASFTFSFSNVVSPRATAGCPNGETVVILFRSGGRVNYFVFSPSRNRPPGGQNHAKRGPTHRCLAGWPRYVSLATGTTGSSFCGPPSLGRSLAGGSLNPSFILQLLEMLSGMSTGLAKCFVVDYGRRR